MTPKYGEMWRDTNDKETVMVVAPAYDDMWRVISFGWPGVPMDPLSADRIGVVSQRYLTGKDNLWERVDDPA